MRGKDALEGFDWFTETERRVLGVSLDRGLGCPRTSSAGRLFDGVSALLGIKTMSAFEGQAAMALEHVAEEESGVYPFAVQEGVPLIIDWAPLMEALLEEKRGGVSVGKISARFHNTLVDVIAAVARRAGEKRVALSGGCFQNARLLSGAAKRLSAEGFDVLFHRRVPTNDGGLSLGQAAVVLAGGGLPCV
jgi:hydrogenase maturation protein HypF